MYGHSTIKMSVSRFLLLLALASLLQSCDSIKLGHAEKSLQGTWHVKSIYSNEQDASGPNKDGKHKESGELGTFIFSGTEVSHSYTRLGKNYTDTSPWKLSAERHPISFHSYLRFTLSLKNQSYEVRFGDRTSDSEKDARRIELHPASPTYHNDRHHIMKLIKE